MQVLRGARNQLVRQEPIVALWKLSILEGSSRPLPTLLNCSRIGMLRVAGRYACNTAAHERYESHPHRQSSSSRLNEQDGMGTVRERLPATH